MGETVIKNQAGELLRIPREEWERHIELSRMEIETKLAFMSDEHHKVRNFAVRRLPQAAEPLAPGLIAAELDLSEDNVITILDDLEKHLTFLYRNEDGHVAWAYPVTVEQTPHHYKFKTGEQIYAA